MNDQSTQSKTNGPSLGGCISMLVALAVCGTAFVAMWRLTFSDQGRGAKSMQSHETSTVDASSPPQNQLSSSDPKPADKFENAIVLTYALAQHFGGTDEYNHSLGLTVRYKNLTSKTIVGMKARIELKNRFGDNLRTLQIESYDEIKQQKEGSISKNYKLNPFFDGDVRLMDLSPKDIIVWLKPTKLMFSDGSVLTSD